MPIMTEVMHKIEKMWNAGGGTEEGLQLSANLIYYCKFKDTENAVFAAHTEAAWSESVMNTFYIVVPCYNEEEVLPEAASRLKMKMSALLADGKIAADSKVLLVNDGSGDKTWDISGSFALGTSSSRGYPSAATADIKTRFWRAL
jgi:hypothetical protein